MRQHHRSTFLFAAFVCLTAPALADDWPQWRGPNRDAHWLESGIRESLPAEDLPADWRTPIGLGYAGPAVAEGKVFVFDYTPASGDLTNNPGGRAALEGTERLLCLDSATGAKQWEYSYPRSYEISYPSGPRCTPTVDGDRVYALGAEGDLSCLRTADGSLVWKKSFREEFDAPTPLWGHSAHPLVEGDLLICLVGGKGSIVVAFNKLTGEEVWRGLTASEVGYCPPTMIEHGGERQLVVWDADNIHGLSPKTGELLWELPLKPAYGMSIAAPQQQGELLFASGMGGVGALMKLDPTGRAADYVWTGKPKTAVYCSNSTPMIEGDVLYGVDIEQSALVAVDLKTGDRLWQEKSPITGDERGRHGTAFLIKQGEQHVLFNEMGDLVLAKLSADGYEDRGKTHLLEPTGEAFGRPVVWSHPAFAERSVFARNDKEIVRVGLAAPSQR